MLINQASIWIHRLISSPWYSFNIDKITALFKTLNAADIFSVHMIWQPWLHLKSVLSQDTHPSIVWPSKSYLCRHTPGTRLTMQRQCKGRKSFKFWLFSGHVGGLTLLGWDLEVEHENGRVGKGSECWGWRRSQWRSRNALRSPSIRRVPASVRWPAGCGAPFSVCQIRVWGIHIRNSRRLSDVWQCITRFGGPGPI